jgi:chromosome segregation ATPase
METEARLAEARAELLRDRETFERQVNSVYERLMTERQQLADQQRRLQADRSHLVLIGRRLRRRWHGQHLSAERSLKQREAWLNACAHRLERDSAKHQKERAALQSLRDRMAAQKSEAAKERGRLEADLETLKQQRTALVDFRICVEADCRRAEERRRRLYAELQELECRIENLGQQFVELQTQFHVKSAAQPSADGQNQKVA